MKLKSLLILILCLGVTLGINSKSLWSEHTRSAFSDRKAIKQGDIITIIVEESSMAQSNNTTESGKNVEMGGEVGEKTPTSDKTVFSDIAKMIPLFGATIKGGSDYKGSSKNARSAALTAKIAVKVDSIDENGNLKLIGERNIKINKTVQKMVLTGLCRIDDVSTDNTISSTKIADAKITFNGNVDFSDKKRKGFFTKVANGVWNFLF
jgi:flagellar L-ring protein precursor FlgH